MIDRNANFFEQMQFLWNYAGTTGKIIVFMVVAMTLLIVILTWKAMKNV